MNLKKLLAVVFLATVTSFAAKANLTYIQCANGTIDSVGDALYEIQILEDGVQFFPYEGSFSFDGTEINYSTSGVISIVDKKVSVTSEGETWTSTKNIMLVLTDNDTKLQAAISTDGGPFQSYEMQCKTIIVPPLK